MSSGGAQKATPWLRNGPRKFFLTYRTDGEILSLAAKGDDTVTMLKVTTTRYRLTCAPNADTFASATEAVLFAIKWGLSPKWEAVTK